MNVETGIWLTGMDVIVFAELSLAGIVSTETNSITRPAMSFAGTDVILVSTNAMTGIEYLSTDVTSIVCRNNREPKLWEEAHSSP